MDNNEIETMAELLDVLLAFLNAGIPTEIRKFLRSRKISPGLEELEDFVLTKAKNKEDKIEVLTILTNYGTEKPWPYFRKPPLKKKTLISTRKFPRQ